MKNGFDQTPWPIQSFDMASPNAELTISGTWQMPSRRRVVVALLVGAAVPTSAFVCAFLLPDALQTGMGLGDFLARMTFWMLAGLTKMIPAVLVGGLLYALTASKVHRDSIWLLLFCLLAGGFAAILGDICIGLKDLIGSESKTRFSYADAGGYIYLDSERTAYGWQRYAENTAKVFAYGMLGGLIFWWIARPKRRAEPGIDLQLSSDRP